MTTTSELSEHAAIAEGIIGSIVEASSPALSPDGCHPVILASCRMPLARAPGRS